MSSHIAHVVGARPNFPKAAPVIRSLGRAKVHQQVIHTGQHYDEHMSDSFFRQLGMPEPDLNLGVGSGTHATQTAAVMTGLEPVLISDRPGILVVYGDVNSTLAAALVAAKLNIAVAHVEAGLRSGDRAMPEEINRLLTDRISEILFATSPDAVAHLGREGVAPEKIHFVGNPMIDSLLEHMDLFDTQRVLKQIEVSTPYAVATLHRPANVDGPAQAAELVKALHASADLIRIVMPLHPRGRHQLQAAGLLSHPNITVVDPLGYGEFLGLVRGAAAVLTDSGGVQEETTILGIPCLTLRANTERPVTITHGTNRLVGVRSLPSVLAEVLSDPMPQRSEIPPLWDGKAGQRIAEVLLHWVA